MAYVFLQELFANIAECDRRRSAKGFPARIEKYLYFLVIVFALCISAVAAVV